MRSTLTTVLLGLCVVAPATGRTEAVRLTSPIVQGSSVYSQAQLLDLFSDELGQPVSTQSIGAIVAAIEARYRNDGFVAPTIAIAPSSAETGTPRLFLREARISRVEVYGDAGPNGARVQRYVDAIRRQPVIHREHSRTYLNAIERLPGTSVRASFEPDREAPNQYVLVMNLRYRAGGAAVDVSNRGTRAVGRNIVSARLSENGMLHWQEALHLDLAASTSFDRYHYAGLRLVRPFGTGTITLLGSRSEAEPFDQVTIYRRNRAAIRLLMPIYQSEPLETSYVLGLGAWTGKVGDDIGPLREERIRKVEAGLNLVWRGAGRLQISSLLTRGLPTLGADSFTYVYDLIPARFEFTKALLDVEYSRALGAGFLAGFELSAQLADDELPGAEQFAFGGQYLGRSFDAGELTGDSGLALGVSLQRSGSWLPGTDEVSVYAGADYGAVWGTSANRAGDNAASANLGLTARRARWSGSFEIGYPLNRAALPESPSGLRSFISMRMGF